MKTAVKNSALGLLIVLIIASIWKASTLIPEPTNTPTQSESVSPSPTQTFDLVGCYVNFNDSNKYVLKILSFDGVDFTAFVGYYNDGFDSSSGVYVGSFRNQILDGIYSFTSEGSDSKRELVFKFEDGNFTAGFGEYEMVEGVELLTSLNSVKWFDKYTYMPNSDCDPPAN